MKRIDELQKKSALAALLFFMLFIFIIFISNMEAITIWLGAIMFILWIITFGLIAYRSYLESKEITERTKLLKSGLAKEALALEAYHKLLEQRNEILQSSNADLRTTLERQNETVEKAAVETPKRKRGRPAKAQVEGTELLND